MLIHKDIINAEEFRDKVDTLLRGAPPTVQRHISTIRPWLRAAIEDHESIRVARRRKSDPQWAHLKFDNGHRLYRFDCERFENATDFSFMLDELARLAEIADSCSPLAREAKSFLKGLPHHQDSISESERRLAKLLDQAERAAFRAKRHDVCRAPLQLTNGSLSGWRCQTLQEIMQLGREARNCLADSQSIWRLFVEGRRDLWSLHESERLVAVLEVNPDTNKVVEALGIGNNLICLKDVQQVAQFCKAASWEIGDECDGILNEFAGPYILEPRIIDLDGRVAQYAEWETAVRIELTGKVNEVRELFSPVDTLTVAFDPVLSCGEWLLSEKNSQDAVVRFGRKRVRRIVRAVALSQRNPTLVQHRLLALIS